ncbi:hypothetical protein BR93DRAFT_968365 [Coniochaeta sp. PMI_546]|nr:hypothetical protein BR93DRAFT_968365 [Coniochaeta sp. PMI_546]
MLPTLLRRAAQGSRSQLDLPNVAFKLKKVWPPDFTKLSPQEQLRLEKKYKRRAQLATARPTWNKAIKLAQLFTITFVVIYGVFYMETKDEHNPFLEVRKKFWEIMAPFTSQERPVRRTLDSPRSLENRRGLDDLPISSTSSTPK